jgi:hypothetical protein
MMPVVSAPKKLQRIVPMTMFAG